jgi:hypothetical protein
VGLQEAYDLVGDLGALVELGGEFHYPSAGRGSRASNRQRLYKRDLSIRLRFPRIRGGISYKG